MKKLLLSILIISSLSSCGTMKIGEADRKLIKDGKKSLLVTKNPEPLFYFTGIPILLDKLFGHPVSIDIKTIDGKEIEEWYRANEAVAVEPGSREIVAEGTQKITDVDRDIDDKSNSPKRSFTQTIYYTFEGGKKYRILID